MAALGPMKRDKRAATMIDGVTGKNFNSTFENELIVMEQQQKNIPTDIHFTPLCFSMDIGTSSPSAFYIIGADNRYMVTSGSTVLPLKIVAKGEYSTDPKNDIMTIPERYKHFLTYVWKLGFRFPELKNRKEKIILYVDGSAKDTIELFKAYITELRYENDAFDLHK
ncbi:MAG: hypothetical protein ACK5MR_05115 [Cumulibacter sp.]